MRSRASVGGGEATASKTATRGYSHVLVLICRLGVNDFHLPFRGDLDSAETRARSRRSSQRWLPSVVRGGVGEASKHVVGDPKTSQRPYIFNPQGNEDLMQQGGRNNS